MLDELGFDRRIVQHFDDLAIPEIQNVDRRFARRDERVPVGRIESRIAGFRDCRNVGQRARAFDTRRGECPQFAGFEIGRGGIGNAHIHVDASRQQVGHRRSAALVRNMNDIDAGALLEEFARKMSGAADARGSVGEDARVFLRQRDKFAERLCRHFGMNHDDVGKYESHRNGCDVALRIVGKVLHHVRRDGHRSDRRQMDRVAVGRRHRDLLCRDVAARARFVLDGHRLTDVLGELLRDDPRRCVRAAAWREADDQRDGAVGKSLRNRNRADRKQERHPNSREGSHANSPQCGTPLSRADAIRLVCGSLTYLRPPIR